MPEIQIPEKLYPVFTGPARYRGAHGGRGGAKSMSFAIMLLVKGMEVAQRFLCTREIQNTIRDSVHHELCNAIDVYGLGGFYDYGVSYITGVNGTEFIYKGLRHNAKEIKSLKGINIAWVEEAESVSEASWRVLIPTIREPDSEIWMTWNPERLDAPVQQRFVNDCPQDAKIAEMNWRDNPWFPKVLDIERRRDQERDHDMYRHTWEGDCITRSDAQVMGGKWMVKSFIPNAVYEPMGLLGYDEPWDGPYQGADWGFSVDPTVMVRLWIHDECLYFEYDPNGIGIELDDIPALFDQVERSRGYMTRADGSRPETISHIKRKGFKIKAAKKWQGSVEDGIAFLRKFKKIVIHPRCKLTAYEAENYCYKVDRHTGDVLPDILDKHNHTWDAARYALEPLIKAKNKFWMVTL